MKLKIFWFLFGIVLLTVSCSFNPPAVMVVKKQRIYTASPQGTLTERLSLFVLLEDTDGRNDYKQLVLREDATGLEWMIQRENSVFLQEAGFAQKTQWIGSNKFRYPRRFFPPGSYTVVAEDLSGQKAETVFTLEDPPPIAGAPFTFQLDKGQWHITRVDETLFSDFSLIFLSADLQPLSTRQIRQDSSGQYSGSVYEEGTADARYIQCCAENTERTAVFFSSPLLLP